MPLKIKDITYHLRYIVASQLPVLHPHLDSDCSKWPVHKPKKRKLQFRTIPEPWVAQHEETNEMFSYHHQQHSFITTTQDQGCPSTPFYLSPLICDWQLTIDNFQKIYVKKYCQNTKWRHKMTCSHTTYLDSLHNLSNCLEFEGSQVYMLTSC